MGRTIRPLQHRAILSRDQSNRWPEIIFADGLDGCVAALCVQATHDAMNVILNRKFRYVHGLGDFLICKTAGQERNELLLPAGKAKSMTEPLIQDQGSFARGPRDELKKVMAEARWGYRFSRNYLSHGSDDVFGARLAEEIPTGSGSHGLKELLGIILHSEKDGFSLWRRR